jgi:hypothetical protein
MAFQSPGRAGVCLPASFTSTPHVDLQREVVRQLEHAGYQAIWTNEVIGKDAFGSTRFPTLSSNFERASRRGNSSSSYDRGTGTDGACFDSVNAIYALGPVGFV